VLRVGYSFETCVRSLNLFACVRAKRMQRTGQVKSSVGSNSCTLLTATSFGWQSTIAARCAYSAYNCKEA